MEPVKERRDKHLSPGERFLTWCKGVVMVWPVIVPLLGLSAYGNSDTIKRWVKGADDITPTVAQFDEQVIYAIDQINDRLEAISNQVKQLESRSVRDDGAIRAEIRAVAAKVKKWHE